MCDLFSLSILIVFFKGSETYKFMATVPSVWVFYGKKKKNKTKSRGLAM
jgi:hypothetical protein